MYAVIETGGKQYRVEVGTELEIERLEAAPGEAVSFDRILLVADGDTAAIGRPVVANASVAAEVVRRDRGEKLISFKYRPKARRRVKKGHRQELTVVRISDIVLDGHSAAGDVAKAAEERRTERQRLEAAARKQAEADAALAARLAAEQSVSVKAASKVATKTKAETKAKPATKAEAKTKVEAATKAEAKTKAETKTAAAPKVSRGRAKAGATSTEGASDRAARTGKADTTGAVDAEASTKEPKRARKSGKD
jgi:large subunit ribosomal protein L21